MSEFTIYWPIIASIFALLGGVAGFIVALLRIKQLKLSIEKLEKEVRETKESIYRPTPDEIKKYGKALERFASESEHVLERHKEITKSLVRQIEVQSDELEEQMKKTFKLFDESEYRIRQLREMLNELKSDFGKFGEAGEPNNG